MDQATTLTTGREPGAPLEDSVVRRSVFADAGRAGRDAAACIAGAGPAFGYDKAAVLPHPPAVPAGQVVGTAQRLAAAGATARLPRPRALHDLGTQASQILRIRKGGETR